MSDWREFFLPLELAELVKEVGFDETCIATKYGKNTDEKDPEKIYLGYNGEGVPTPTYDQIFNWFREKHKIHVQFCPRHFNNDDIRWSMWTTILDLWLTNVGIDDNKHKGKSYCDKDLEKDETLPIDGAYKTLKIAKYVAIKGVVDLIRRLPGIKEKYYESISHKK